MDWEKAFYVVAALFVGLLGFLFKTAFDKIFTKNINERPGTKTGWSREDEDEFVRMPGQLKHIIRLCEEILQKIKK